MATKPKSNENHCTENLRQLNSQQNNWSYVCKSLETCFVKGFVSLFFRIFAKLQSEVTIQKEGKALETIEESSKDSDSQKNIENTNVTNGNITDTAPTISSDKDDTNGDSEFILFKAISDNNKGNIEITNNISEKVDEPADTTTAETTTETQNDPDRLEGISLGDQLVSPIIKPAEHITSDKELTFGKLFSVCVSIMFLVR